jgi:hypothetical protein
MSVQGCPYEIVPDAKKQDIISKLLGMPCETVEIKVVSPVRKWKGTRIRN